MKIQIKRKNLVIELKKKKEKYITYNYSTFYGIQLFVRLLTEV